MVLNKQDFYRFADFELHPSKRALLRGEQRVLLAPKSFEVLTFLVQNAGRVVLKEELLKAVWPESFVEESNLTQHIFWLRKALGDRATYIVTVPGRGYQFTPRVSILNEAEQQEAEPQASLAVADSTQYLVEKSPMDFEETTTSRSPYAIRGRFFYSRSLRVATWIAALGLVGFGGWFLWRGRHPILRGGHHEIVLASFENKTGDASFDHALNTLLAIDLNQSPYLVVASENDTRHVLELMNRKPDDTLVTPVALEVCQRLNDQAILGGAIANFGRRYLFTLSATDCQTGKTMVQSKAVADGNEAVLKAVDSVASDMRKRLGESLATRTIPAEKLPLAHTYSLDALRSYSMGLSVAASDRNREAVPLFERAVELDPKFAVAYLELALAYSGIAEDDRSKQAMKKAYELRDQADNFSRLRIIQEYNVTITGDLRARHQNLIAWTNMYPNQLQPWMDLSASQGSLGRYDEGVEPARRALALAPNSPNPYEVLGNALLHTGAIDEALAVFNEAVRRGIDTPLIHYGLGEIYYARHDSTGMARQYDYFKGRDEEVTFPVLILFAEGKAHAAIARWLQGVQQAREQGFPNRAERRQSVLLHREVDYNLDAELRQQMARFSSDDYDINPILANVELGRIADAQRGVRSMLTHMGTDTTLDESFYPEAKAAIDLAQHKPQQAIADLEPTRAFGLDSVEAILMRGHACLAAHQPACAKESFRFILDHPYLYAEHAFYPLSTLGLAETFEMEGNHAAARKEYEALFVLWKDADADLPPLIRAQREYEKIQ